MFEQQTFEAVAHIISERFAVSEEQLTPETTFQQDLGADSIDVVELVMALEDQFGVQISDEDAEGIVTVSDAVHYIESHQ